MIHLKFQTMKYFLFSLILFLFALKINGQQNSLSTDSSWNWLDMYYEGDTALKSQLVTFYELLNNIETAQEVDNAVARSRFPVGNILMLARW